MHRFARVEIAWLKSAFLRWFVKKYGVNLAEAERENIEDYKHINDFFTRSLKPSARALADTDITSPVDGVVSQAGEIHTGQILQAKSHHYSVQQLLADSASTQFDEGQFATIYLSPKDYHRIHMPFDGQLKSMKYIPGDLFSVNQKTADNVDGLFARNERLVCYFETAFGEVAFILVGAILVGSMEVVWEGKITPPYTKSVKEFDYSVKGIKLAKGEEMGRFNMGSTVIILLPKGAPTMNLLELQSLRMGQALI
ncbi:MAG: archaetidylserine decarboxylase [Gammaproteobacteria bacterium]|nr:archaetidylserine decarboxylase [Gammaproteobacteria bacterium]